MRCLPKAVENFRLREIKQQINEFENNKKLQEKFDYIICNDYTEESLNNSIDLIKNIKERRYVRI